MAQYYYFAASLPMLFYDSERVPNRELFLQTCRQHLSGRDYHLLAETSLDNPKKRIPGSRTLDRWREWETALRNELVLLRAKSKGWEAEPHLAEAPFHSAVQQVAREALEQDSPLAAEDVLNRARWSCLDELEVGHYFDIEKILVYYLRLQLLERKALHDADRGSEAFHRIFKSLTAPVYADESNQIAGENRNGSSQG